MKCRLLFILVLLGFQSLAQAPQQINFQGVLRDNAGAAIRNQQVTIVVSFRELSAETLRYRESHTTSTDNFGLIQLSLGTGTVVSGTFDNINWASEQISFLATATLPNGNVVEISEQKFLSVPYALHATTATSLSGEDDTDVTNELNESLSLNGSVLTVTDAGGDVSLDLSAIDNQTLQINGTNLSIQNGNQVDLGFLEDDADADPENEIQHLSLSGSTLSLSGSEDEINLTGIGVEADDQNAAQVPYDGVAAQMDADNVQEAIDELAAEKVRNLQEAYAANSLITLDGSNNLQVNTSGGTPLFSTTNDGRIGIGTSNPDVQVDISSSSPDAPVNLELSNSDNTHRLTFFPGRTNDPNPFIAVQPGDPLRFATYDGVNFNELMRISPTGNLGLGTSVATHRMHVVGQTSPLTGMDAIENFAGSIETGGVFDFVKGGSESRTAGIVVRSGGGGENYGILGLATSEEADINRGTLGISTGADVNVGITGNAIGQATQNFGTYGYARNASTNYGAIGISNGAGTANIGVYGAASQGTTNFAGYFLGNVNIVSGSLRFNNIPYLHLGNGNFSIGETTRNNLTTAAGNIALGNGSLQNITANFDNVGIGLNALANLSIGNNNVAIGRYPMNNATSGSDNVAIGHSVLATNTTGSNNIGLGYLMLRSNTTGSSNIAFGNHAMDNNITGSHNVAIGQYSGTLITNQNDNVLVGRNTNIANNAERGVALGYNARVGLNDAVILGDANNAAVRVGIGTESPTEKLHVNGNIYITGIVTGPSDRRLKTDITPLNNALAAVEQLDGVSYFWNNDNPNKDIKQFGLIAQDLEKVLPELVQTKPDGYKSVNYTSLIPFLIEAIKEQQNEIEKLKSENADLKSTMESKIDALAAAVKTLETSVNSKSQQTLSSDEK